jgi:hypothetical protein
MITIFTARRRQGSELRHPPSRFLAAINIPSPFFEISHFFEMNLKPNPHPDTLIYK